MNSLRIASDQPQHDFLPPISRRRPFLKGATMNSHHHSESCPFNHRLAVMCLALLCAAVNGVYAATITVTSTADSGTNTLRDAIANAASGDTIEFAVTGTISTFSGLLIKKSLVINGP